MSPYRGTTNNTPVEISDAACEAWSITVANPSVQARFVHLLDNTTLVFTMYVPALTTVSMSQIVAPFRASLNWKVSTAADGTGSPSGSETILNLIYNRI